MTIKKFIQKLNVFAVAGVLLASLSFASLTPAFVSASTKEQVCQGIAGSGGGNACTGDGGNALGNFIKKIINILLFIIGAIAVIMIIIGGIRYVVSGGDQGQVTSAKNTVLYAVIGLIVAIMAYAIVNFVVSKI